MHSPKPNVVGYAILGAFAVAFFWAVRRASGSADEQAWVPASEVKQGIREVLWKASTDDHPDTNGPPQKYEPASNKFWWGNVSHPAVKLWGYR